MNIKHFAKDCLKWLESVRINRPLTGKPIVFQCRDGAPGLFSYVVHVLGFVRYAHKHGLVPVVDLQTFENTYLGKDSVGKINAWEHYFKQPAGKTLKDVDLSECEIFDTRDQSRNGQLKMPWWDWECYDQDSVTCKMWRAYAKRYIKLSDNALAKVDETYKRLVKPGEKVLGIQCRGTDYTRHKPHAHPVQPSPEMVMDKAAELVKQRGYDKIFLATEDGVVFRKFKERFGDLIIASDDTHVDYDGKSWVNNILPQGEQEKLDHGMAYLISMAMLTRCDAFIAGRTSGSIGVMLLSEGFEYSYIFDLGFYD